MMNFQDVVDELADSIGRSVVIGDPHYRLIAASALGADVDDIRSTTLLQRQAPAPHQKYLESLSLNDSHQPVTVDFRELGGRERLAVPVRGAHGHLATLWLITGDLPPLRGADYAAIEAAVSITRDLLANTEADREPGTSDEVMGQLLASDPEVRKSAFDEAVLRRRLERGDGTLVYAVDVSATISLLDRLAFARRLTTTRTSSISYIGERHNVMLFVGRSTDSVESEAAIRHEAVSRAIVVNAIGTAHHSRFASDLAAAAEHAALAAGIVFAVPDLGGSADISTLGPWAMLASVVGDRSQLAIFSPAAYALCTDGDETQRTTIEVYLDGVGHVSHVCEQLHIHRATLYYRLERMPDVVKAALDDGVQRSALHLCLKLIRLWEASGRF
jgi:hypothetical protein